MELNIGLFQDHHVVESLLLQSLLVANTDLNLFNINHI
jgi:hypothetical protein